MSYPMSITLSRKLGSNKPIVPVNKPTKLTTNASFHILFVDNNNTTTTSATTSAATTTSPATTTSSATTSSVKTAATTTIIIHIYIAHYSHYALMRFLYKNTVIPLLNTHRSYTERNTSFYKFVEHCYGISPLDISW